MAIEFNCPYCTAVIRVPDNAGGGKGRCPKCATRLSVPKVSTPKRGAPPVEPKVVLAPPPAEQPLFTLDVSLPEASSLDNSIPGVDPLDVNFADALNATDDALPSDSMDIFSADHHADTVAPKPRRKKSGVGWKVPAAVVVLLFAAAGGWFFWQEKMGASLSGDLIAETADELDLPPGFVEKSLLGSSSEIAETILTKLEKSPMPLTSSLMQVQLSGHKKGLLIRLNPGLQSRFYRVDVSDNLPLRQFRSKHAPELEGRRMFEVEQAAKSFATTYNQILTKKLDMSSVGEFRDTLALPALVRGVGHQLIATHGRTAYPCVYEDSEGAWYFLMPPDVKSFIITGRKDASGTVAFPATFKVKVAGMLKPLSKVGDKQDEEPSSKSKGKSKKTPEESEPSDVEMDSNEDPAMKSTKKS